MRSLGAMAAAAAALALALAACGSGSERSEESAPPTTTKQDTAADVTTTEAKPEPITAAEQRWLEQIERYGERLEDEIALGGAITHSTMRREARLYLECARVLSGQVTQGGSSRRAASPSGRASA